MKLEDCKDGEIYTWEADSHDKSAFINMFQSSDKNIKYFIRIDGAGLIKNATNNSPHNIRESSAEEKHWLLECIKADKFISKEEAFKTFRSTVTEFKKGDYIVTLKVDGINYNCARNNYCFKQRIDSSSMAPVKDLSNSTTNSHIVMASDKKQKLEDWRYATEAEIKEYDRLGKPYDVTVISGETKFMNEYVECVTSNELHNFKPGNIYFINDKGYITNEKDSLYHQTKFSFTKFYSNNFLFKYSTKEAFDKQKSVKEIPISKFKDGDTVKIIGNSNSSCNKIGDIGILVYTSDNGGDVQVHCRKDIPLGCYTFFTEMELYTGVMPIKEPVFIEVAKDLPGQEYKPGDWVTISTVVKGPNRCAEDNMGKTFQVTEQRRLDGQLFVVGEDFAKLGIYNLNLRKAYPHEISQVKIPMPTVHNGCIVDSTTSKYSTKIIVDIIPIKKLTINK